MSMIEPNQQHLGAPLSDAGLARRTRILDLALGVQRKRVMRRRAVRAGAALAVLGAMVLGVRFGWTSTAPREVAFPSGPIASTAPELPRRASMIELVHTSATPPEHIASGNAGAYFEVISDAELLDLLKRTGHDVGLVRTQGKARIVGNFQARDVAHDVPTSG